MNQIAQILFVIFLVVVFLILAFCKPIEKFGCMDDDDCHRDGKGGCEKVLINSNPEPEGIYTCICDDMICKIK